MEIINNLDLVVFSSLKKLIVNLNENLLYELELNDLNEHNLEDLIHDKNHSSLLEEIERDYKVQIFAMKDVFHLSQDVSYLYCYCKKGNKKVKMHSYKEYLDFLSANLEGYELTSFGVLAQDEMYKHLKNATKSMSRRLGYSNVKKIIKGDKYACVGLK